MKTYKSLLCALSVLALFSCSKDLLNQSPSITYDDATVLGSKESVKAVLMGGYGWNTNFRGIMIGKTSLDVMADNFTITDGTYGLSTYNWIQFAYDYVQYPRIVDGWWSAYASYLWKTIYATIDACNQIIANEESLPAGCEDFVAQARALRGYSYMFLYNLFCQSYSAAGDDGQGLFLRTVPGNTDKDANPKRSNLKDSFTFIMDDLKYGADNIANADDWTLLTKKACQVLLARAYLELGNYKEARKCVNGLSSYDGSDLMSADQYTNSFSAANDEWLWGIRYTSQTSSIYASFPSFWYLAAAKDKDSTFGTPGYGGKTDYDTICEHAKENGVELLEGYSTVRATTNFVNTFKDGDCRKLFPFHFDLKDGYFISKLRSASVNDLGVCDYPLVRLAEAYLIKAECEFRINGGGLTVLNALQTVRNGYVSTAINEDEIIKERARELYGEGTGLIDLKRMKRPLNRTDACEWSRVKTLPANSPRMMFPIPGDELDYNPNAAPGDQNEYWR